MYIYPSSQTQDRLSILFRTTVVKIPPFTFILRSLLIAVTAIIISHLLSTSSIKTYLKPISSTTFRYFSTDIPKADMQFKYRPSEQRGGADHGWLKTFHTFSFASYYDPRYENFGALRVINEDRVAPGTGFPTHPHREAEIFSYIISGQLSHKDTMGNVETMVRGDIQMTSGGTGIAHSEYNDHPSEGVHFLQIWALPNRRGLKPKYFTRHFTDEQKKDKIAHLVAPVGYEGVEEVRECSGLTPIHSPVHFFSSLITPSISLTHKLLSSLNGKPNKLFYVQLVQSSGYNTESAPKDDKGPLIKVTGGGQEATLGEGDGVFITGGKVGEEISIENVGKGVGEAVLFEMDEE